VARAKGGRPDSWLECFGSSLVPVSHTDGVLIQIEAVDLPGLGCAPSPDSLWLDCIPSEVVASTVDQGLLVGRLGLTDHNGNPLCAAVRPPLIQWSAGSAK
jgi:hypothetical protein